MPQTYTLTLCMAVSHRKILKKHDKMTSTELMHKLMPTVSDMLAKEQRKRALEGLKNSVVHEFALIAHGGGEPEAEQELGRHRRDQLTFERNTGEGLSQRRPEGSTGEGGCEGRGQSRDRGVGSGGGVGRIS